MADRGVDRRGTGSVGAIWHLSRRRVLGRAGVTVLLLGTACLAWFVYNKFVKKHTIACPQCGRIMTVFDSPFSKDQLNPAIDRHTQSLHEMFEHSFDGVDGYIYRMEHGGGSSVSFYRLMKRWYACHDCKRCFLAEERINEHYESVHRNRAMKFKESLVTDDSDVRESLKRLQEE
jgi:DNA-directed RNA polymerase subunit RPC12/RpoP